MLLTNSSNSCKLHFLLGPLHFAFDSVHSAICIFFTLKRIAQKSIYFVSEMIVKVI